MLTCTFRSSSCGTERFCKDGRLRQGRQPLEGGVPSKRNRTRAPSPGVIGGTIGIVESDNKDPTIWDYYEALVDLRDALERVGLHDWSSQLLEAERSASTGGEGLSNSGVILRTLVESGTIGDPGLSRQVEAVSLMGRRLWNGAGNG